MYLLKVQFICVVLVEMTSCDLLCLIQDGSKVENLSGQNDDIVFQISLPKISWEKLRKL